MLFKGKRNQKEGSVSEVTTVIRGIQILSVFLLFGKSDVSNYMTLLPILWFLEAYQAFGLINLPEQTILQDMRQKLSCTVCTLATNNWESKFKYLVYHQRS